MRTLRELSSLDGRVALVVGGGGHIGAGVCEALAELGAAVAIADVGEERAAAVAAELPQASAHVVDLRDESETRALVQAVVARWGALDVLVHCAAYVGTTQRAGWNVPFAEQSVEAWDAAFRVNLTSAFVLAQEARPALERSGAGSLVLMSSIYGALGPDLRLYAGTSMHNPTAYGASKGALIQLGRSLATQLAPRVRVNVVSPGGIARGQPASFVEAYEARTPLGRMGTEEDLKGAVAFLASGLSRYVTGQNLMVDGGWSAW